MFVHMLDWSSDGYAVEIGAIQSVIKLISGLPGGYIVFELEQLDTCRDEVVSVPSTEN
jgi:hypothetical protein